MDALSTSWFLTGTDTEINKTLSTGARLCTLRSKLQRVVSTKTVSAANSPVGRNDGVVQMQAVSFRAFAGTIKAVLSPNDAHEMQNKK